jgi:Uma2 family endonuclease
MEIATLPPIEEKRTPMNYEAFLAWADEHTHVEWEEGEAIVFMPKPRHQDIVTFLVAIMRFFAQFFHLGQVFTAPLEMKVAPTSNAREPDILFIARTNLARLTEDRLAGPADLVVEVISDESLSRDRTQKFYEYQEAGVSEYWLIDPRPGKERADFWVLDEQNKYQPIPIDKNGVYHSTILTGFWLRIDWLWLTEKPDPFFTFAELIGLPASLVQQLREFAERSIQNGGNN